MRNKSKDRRNIKKIEDRRKKRKTLKCMLLNKWKEQWIKGMCLSL